MDTFHLNMEEKVSQVEDVTKRRSDGEIPPPDYLSLLSDVLRESLGLLKGLNFPLFLPLNWQVGLKDEGKVGRSRS